MRMKLQPNDGNNFKLQGVTPKQMEKNKLQMGRFV